MGFITFIVLQKKRNTFIRRNKLFPGPDLGEEFVMRFYIRRIIGQYYRQYPGPGTKHEEPLLTPQKMSVPNSASGAHKSKHHWACDAVADIPRPWKFSLEPGMPLHSYPNQSFYGFQNLSSPNSYSPLTSLSFSSDLPDVIKAIPCYKHYTKNLEKKGFWWPLYPR